MKISKVTVTGADDSVAHNDMVDVAARYPYVEWGILVHRGKPWSRFPSMTWIDELGTYKAAIPELPLACHVCGQWVRDLCLGDWPERLDLIVEIFDRIQLNFHGEGHAVDRKAFMDALRKCPDKQFIFQLDNVNDTLMNDALSAGINAAGLFDLSHGAGVLPKEWPALKDGASYGYAGGLSPDNLKDQLEKIAEVVGDNTIWIDAETKLRSDDNNRFMLDKVEEFLTIAAEYTE